MKIRPTRFEDAWLVEAEPFQDERGKFARLFCQEELRTVHKGRPIEQINYSLTVNAGTVRGLHFQFPPKTETKLVRCLRGAVFDVIVDLRRKSPTFLHWQGEVLSGENMLMLYVPEGFAHGFQVLEPNSEILYLHTAFYSPDHEGGVRYNDPRLNIDWPREVTDISVRDQNHPMLTADFSGLAL